MAFNKADIIARLQKGEKIEDIANEMSEILNTAEADYKAAEAQKAAEVSRVEDAKREAVKMMIDGACDYCVAIGEEELLTELHEIDIDKIVTAIDSWFDMIKALANLETLEFKVPTEKKAAAGADSVIANFLRDFGL